MSQATHPAAETSVPADLVAERQAGWVAFTQFIKVNCLAVIGVLVFLLLVAKVF